MIEYNEFHTLENVMVSMRDGVRLATDIHLPARDGKPLDGPWPVVMVRTPYDKTRLGDQASIVRPIWLECLWIGFLFGSE